MVGVSVEKYTGLSDKAEAGQETITGDVFLKQYFSTSPQTTGLTNKDPFSVCLINAKLMFQNGQVVSVQWENLIDWFFKIYCNNINNNKKKYE